MRTLILTLILTVCLLASACTCAPSPDDACTMATGAALAITDTAVGLLWVLR